MTIPINILQRIAGAVGAECVSSTQLIQHLWGGYGELFRVELAGCSQHESVIVKYIKLPQPEHHPRGWNTITSHQRKLDSYQVEVSWYQHFANQCKSECVVPKCLFVTEQDGEILLILEDLKTLGFSEVHKEINQEQVKTCLYWLANFHAQHLGVEPKELWECGTYWHLDTRPDEMAALLDLPLKNAAPVINKILKQTPYQTLVHGDAKLANFCFTTKGDRVAGVDFQYVGKGCGMKDVVLLFSSCIPFDECEKRIPNLLDYYFEQLGSALVKLQPQIDPNDVVQAWKPLYCIAWADFQRFVKGWSPEHWKINPYTENLTQKALQQLGLFDKPANHDHQRE